MAPSRGGAALALMLLACCFCATGAWNVQPTKGGRGGGRRFPAQAATELAAPAPPEDPWPLLLAKAQSVRPSALFDYQEQAFPRLQLAVPDVSARLCQCKLDGGWNQTFWLNMACAMYQGEVYVAIVHRTVAYKCSAAYQASPTQVHTQQLVEVNQILLCKLDNITSAAKLRQCQVVEPGPGYIEKHPAGHKRFELVGMIDPRLISAGDDNGLFLQVGCRPKVFADAVKHTKFRETLCLVKLRPGRATNSSGSGSGQGSSPGQAASAAATRALRALAAATAHALRGEHGDPRWRARALQQQQEQGNQHQGQEQQGQRGSHKSGEPQQQQPQGVPLPGMSISSGDLPLGQLMHLQHKSGMNMYEKNWVGFEYRGSVLWSRHLSPHQVVTVHASGTASTLFRTSSTEALTPLAHICGKGPRGNTPAVRLSRGQTGLPMDVYLGVLHYTPRRGHRQVDVLNKQCDEYLNFFYLMEGEPPFSILEVARTPIPLLASTNPILDNRPLGWGMGFISFPTGLLVLGTQVVVTYGSGDREVRIWHTPLQHVLGSFALKWARHPPSPPRPPEPPSAPPLPSGQQQPRAPTSNTTIAGGGSRDDHAHSSNAEQKQRH